jgi:hypothetical protein
MFFALKMHQSKINHGKQKLGFHGSTQHDCIAGMRFRARRRWAEYLIGFLG